MSGPSGAPAAPLRPRRWVPETGLQAAIWALVMICVLAPVVPLIYASLQDKPIYASGRAFTLAAYGQLLSDAAFLTAALNTLEFACLTTVSAVVLGAGFAMLCSRTDVLGRRVYARLFVVPILLPGLGVILGWNALYGEGGYAHDVLTQTLHLPFDLTTVPGMAALGTATAVPVVFLICQAALSGIDSSLENAARGVGASPLRVLTRVTLPMLRPALLNSGLLVFTLAVEALGIPLVFGSPQGHDFVASYLYNTWSNALTPDPRSSAPAPPSCWSSPADSCCCAGRCLATRPASSPSAAGRPRPAGCSLDGGGGSCSALRWASISWRRPSRRSSRSPSPPS